MCITLQVSKGFIGAIVGVAMAYCLIKIVNTPSKKEEKHDDVRVDIPDYRDFVRNGSVEE